MRAAENAGGFWGNVDPGVKKGLVILVAGGLTFYVGRRFWKKYRSQKILKNALFEGSLASVAEKINVAVTGWGTDEQKVYEAFSDIPTQAQAAQVARLYKDAYTETLDEALREDLNTEELQTVKNIIAGKPKNKLDKPNYKLLEDWLRRLGQAAGTFLTDEDAIYRVLWEVPDKKGYVLLSAAAAAKKLSGYKSLVEYLQGQLGGSGLAIALYIMKRKK